MTITRQQPGLKSFAENVYINIGREAKHRKFQRTYRNDRVAFVYDCIPILRDTFAPYQEEILANFDSGIRRQAVRSPHGAGKTMLAAIIVHHTMLCIEEDVKVPTLASVWRQLEKYLWPEIHKIAQHLDWTVIGREPYSRRDELLTLNMRLNNGVSEAYAVASGDAMMIEGAHASTLFYVFDEAKAIDKDMWQAAEGAFSTEGSVSFGGESYGEAYWLAISTPGIAMGEFYNIHAKKEGYEDWHVRHITRQEAVDAGRIGEEWAEQRKKLWGVTSAAYKSRVLGDFGSTGTEGLIPMDWVEAAQERWKAWADAGKPNLGIGLRELGIDVARYGSDSSVIAEKCDDRIEELHVYYKKSLVEFAAIVKPLSDKSMRTKIEMDYGLGMGLYDLLDDPYAQMGTLVPIYMGAPTAWMSPIGMHFNSLRSAAWWNLREMLDPDNGASLMLPDDDILLGDLVTPTYTIVYRKGLLTVLVEKKEELKKKHRLGRSPDRGDAVILACWDGGTSTGGKGIVV